ncbi:MAG: hypothetical protein ABIX44_07210 [Cryobacterium sp.]
MRSTSERKHRHEIPIDVRTVRGLLSRQFPDRADLPIEFVDNGTVNEMFRLGAEMACARRG